MKGKVKGRKIEFFIFAHNLRKLNKHCRKYAAFPGDIINYSIKKYFEKLKQDSKVNLNRIWSNGKYKYKGV